MKSLFALILACMLHACAPSGAFAQSSQLFHLHMTITPIAYGATTVAAGAPITVTGTNTFTVTGGSRSLVVMISSDFQGTINGCPFTGNGTAFQDAFNAPPIPANCDIDAVVIVITAGSVRVQDLRQ